MITRLLVGALASLLIGGAAYRRRSLTWSGWLGAVIVGTLTVGCGGWLWGGLIVVFFVSSTVLSQVGHQRKAHLSALLWEKGDQRDFAQVMANGAVPTLAAVGYALWPQPAWWAVALGALATATADTWATEIGVLSSRPPRHMITLQPISAGMSGGVSPLGWLASLLGALLIALAAWLGHLLGWGIPLRTRAWVPLATLAGGFCGSTFDSLLGALWQVAYWCPQCDQPTERHIHRCGAATTYYRGLPWLNNDVVNALSLLAGAGVALLTYALLG